MVATSASASWPLPKRIFARHGFFASRVSEIAKEAGVADGTIYLYFKSKDDLLISWFEHRMTRVIEAMRAAIADKPPSEQLRTMIRTYLQLVSDEPVAAEVLTLELRQSSKFMKEYENPKFAEFLRMLGGVIADGQTRGELEDSIPEPPRGPDDLRHPRRARARVGAREATDRRRRGDLGPRAWYPAKEIRYRARGRLGRRARYQRSRQVTNQGDVPVKILVPVKRVPDPTQKAKIKDGHIDLTGASWIVNTFDEYAIETALRLVENGADNTRQAGAEIIVISLGPDEAAKEIRTCLAMGADRAIHVVTSDREIDALTVVKVLQSVIEAEKPDLVIMGKQAVDGDANQVGQMLAAKLGWPQATFAASIELAGDKLALTVGREVDGGVEYKKVPAAQRDHRRSAHRRAARSEERRDAGDPQLLRRRCPAAVAQGHHGGEEEADGAEQARRSRRGPAAGHHRAVGHAAAAPRGRSDRRRHPDTREEARRRGEGSVRS